MEQNRRPNLGTEGFKKSDSEKKQRLPKQEDSLNKVKKTLTPEQRDLLFKKIAGLRPYLEKRIFNQLGLSFQEADDIASEVILKAYEKVSTLQNDEALKNWLVSLAENHVRDYQRTDIRRKRLLNEALYDPNNPYNEKALKRPQAGLLTHGKVFFDKIDSKPNPEQALSNKRLERLLKAALASLAPAQREVIQMYYFEEMSIGDIVTSLKPNEPNISESAVKLRLFHARNTIKKKLSKFY